MLVGKPDFLARMALPISQSWRRKPSNYNGEGQTVIFVAIDGRAAGVIAVADPIKQSTPGRDRLSASARHQGRYAHRRQRAHGAQRSAGNSGSTKSKRG